MLLDLSKQFRQIKHDSIASNTQQQSAVATLSLNIISARKHSRDTMLYAHFDQLTKQSSVTPIQTLTDDIHAARIDKTTRQQLKVVFVPVNNYCVSSIASTLNKIPTRSLIVYLIYLLRTLCA